MIPPAYPCVAFRYVKKVIKICEWVKNEKSALNLLCNVFGYTSSLEKIVVTVLVEVTSTFHHCYLFYTVADLPLLLTKNSP